MESVDVIVEPIDENYSKLSIANDSIANEIYKRFEFYKPGYRHDPRFKAGMWDGKVAMFSKSSGKILKGLLNLVEDLGHQKIFTITGIDKHISLSGEMLREELQTYGYRFKLDDSQVEAVRIPVINDRALIISPTGSGKTAICYGFARYHATRRRRVLFVIPEVNLLDQFADDLENDFNGGKGCKFLISGVNWHHNDPVGDADVVVTTQRSIYDKPSTWFKQFQAIVGDEAHKYSAPTYLAMIEKCSHIKYRLGCTGSLTEEKFNNHVAYGIFGKEYVVTTAQKQIELGRQSKPTIHAIRLKYSDDTRRKFSVEPHVDYPDEIKWLISHPARNEFLAKLATNLEGNVLTLFRYREHGDELVRLIEQITGEEVNQVDGRVSRSERKKVATGVRSSKSSQSVCTFKTFGTGTNIPNINHVIKASPLKSRTTNMQGDGRGVRIDIPSGKTTVAIYDIYDELVNKKETYPNHSLRHYNERLKIYQEQGYEVIDHQFELE